MFKYLVNLTCSASVAPPPADSAVKIKRAVQRLNRRGRKVPFSISVFGFDICSQFSYHAAGEGSSRFAPAPFLQIRFRSHSEDETTTDLIREEVYFVQRTRSTYALIRAHPPLAENPLAPEYMVRRVFCFMDSVERP